MNVRKVMFTAALAAALMTGAGAVATAAPGHDVPANCMGQHVSMMAKMHGGMAAATAMHNEMHGTDLTVGEHQAHIRDEMCGR